jgi:IclR family acetate operon transcriptional repressor
MVPVVQGTFRILEELAKSGALSLNEVTTRTGMSKSTVFRILTTLNQLGYIVRDDTRSYYVSHAIGNLVSTEAYTDAIRRTAMPHMLELRDLYGETVNLGELELDKVTYVEVVPSEYALRLHERPGATVSVHASALGKAILAFSDEEFAVSMLQSRELPALTPNTITIPDQIIGELKRIRERGYALDKGETSLLATCIAAPILNAQRNAIAAISISGPSSRFNPKKDSPVVDSLLKATAQIAKQLGNGSPRKTRI